MQIPSILKRRSSKWSRNGRGNCRSQPNRPGSEQRLTTQMNRKPEQAEQVEDDKPVDLDEKGIQIVEQYKADMDSKIAKFDSDMTAATDLEQFMAPAPVAKMKLWRLELGLTMDNVNLATESGKNVCFKECKATAADMKKTLKSNTVLLLSRMKQATADKA